VIEAVLDANILVSGFAHASGAPGQLVDRWLADSFGVVTSVRIIRDVELALAKPCFRRRLSPEGISIAVSTLRRHARLTELTTGVSGGASHPEDDRVIATAISAGVPYPVTGDAELRRVGDFEGVAILTPREFLALLDESRL
jgi:putative PIN family toxin of toxin-antitoxin system